MNCIPPWLSSKNQCFMNIELNNQTEKDIKTMILHNFTSPIENALPTKAEKSCKSHCRKMTNTVTLRTEHKELHSYLIIRFKNPVKVGKKTIVYTWFNFIVDIGSSLGLWLGLSALGITDLMIEAYMVAKKWFTIK